MPVFPSKDWFVALQQVVNNDERFKHFGTIDAKIGVRVGDNAYELVFEVYELVSVREISVDELQQCDFYLEQDPESWREMLENIKANGKADVNHTLNTIDLNSPAGLARGSDGYKVDLFYRYNQTLQDFFDASAKVDTEFAIPAR